MKIRPAVAGLVAGASGLVLFMLYAHRFEVERSGGDGVEVLVSMAKIPRGTRVTDLMLTKRTVPQAYLDDRQVRASDRDKIIGLKAAEPVAVAQTILWSDVLRTRDEERDLSSLVQPGYRAVTAPFAAMPTYAMIHPGDFVDVVATVTKENDRRISTVLLQRVLVLAIGDSVGEHNDEPRTPGSQRQPILTLSLNVREAQLLSLASQKSSLSVALRNPNDQRVIDDPADLDLSALLDSPAREEIRGMRKPETVARAPVRLEVERR